MTIASVEEESDTIRQRFCLCDATGERTNMRVKMDLRVSSPSALAITRVLTGRRLFFRFVLYCCATLEGTRRDSGACHQACQKNTGASSLFRSSSPTVHLVSITPAPPHYYHSFLSFSRCFLSVWHEDDTLEKGRSCLECVPHCSCRPNGPK